MASRSTRSATASLSLHLEKMKLDKDKSQKCHSYNTRRKISSKPTLYTAAYSDSEDDCDYSTSSDEFECSSESSGNDLENESNDDEEKNIEFRMTAFSASKLSSRIVSDADKMYIIKSDDYFSNSNKKRIIVSNNTFDKLETPRLQHNELRKILKASNHENLHKRQFHKLTDINRGSFARWLYLMHEGFNVLLYGLGSKMQILRDFHNKYLLNAPVVIMNGFFPSLSIKSLLDAITMDVLELSECPANMHEACDQIAQEMSRYPSLHVYLLVHNIEGDMLKNCKAQGVLSCLASIKNIHLVASIDHVNGPLIWDNVKSSKFNFVWFDVTSFIPYMDETSFESSAVVEHAKYLALSSLNNVFLSLTANSKGIYLIIAKYQLENGNEQHYQGYLFKDLYWACREAFLVSSDLALRSQLAEFVDHKMLRFKRSTDGSEFLIIPTAKNILHQFYGDQSK